MKRASVASAALFSVLAACGGDESGGSGGGTDGGAGVSGGAGTSSAGSSGVGGGSSGGAAGSGGAGGSGGAPAGGSGGSPAGGTGGASGAGGGAGGSGGMAGGGAARSPGAIKFFQNVPDDHDYAHHTQIPAGFGDAEFTLEVWILPDDSFPKGPTGGGGDRLTNWSTEDNMPYGAGDWWYDGNFLLDGHNNSSGFADGTFSLQFYGGGRVRWLFGDGENAGPGGHWSVGAFPATSGPDLLDGNWHLVAAVRRFTGASGSDLELWIDGVLIDTETSPARTNMRQWFDGWAGFPGQQEGWFWGAEKQAAVGVLSQYEDYKGLLGEVRFWSIARSTADLMASSATAITGNETGLVGRFTFSEGMGTSTCDSLAPTLCMDLVRMKPGYWAP